MEQFQQITLNDWMDMKRKLNAELLGVKRSFVRIGFFLRKIDEEKLYENDGYKSVAEFAKQEYGLEGSTVSRFIGINKEYSIDGFSEQLRPEFEDFGRSQLEEMMKLPNADRTMIEPSTSRADIRELKAFNKQEPETGGADDIHKLVEEFFHEHKEELNEAYRDPQDNKNLQEAVNPSGNKSYRKGLYFMMMYETKVSIKKYGETPKEISWEAFGQLMREVFGEASCSSAWENHFGGEEENGPEKTDGIAEEQSRDQPEGTGGNEEVDASGTEKANGEIKPGDNSEDENQSGADTDYDSGASGERERQQARPGNTDNKKAEPKTEERGIAPAQKTAEILEKTAQKNVEVEVVPGVTATITDIEKVSDAARREQIKAEIEAAEEIRTKKEPEAAFGTRKEYMDVLAAEEMAEYIVKEYKEHRLLASSLGYPSMIRVWLSEEVMWNGEPMEKD